LKKFLLKCFKAVFNPIALVLIISGAYLYTNTIQGEMPPVIIAPPAMVHDMTAASSRDSSDIMADIMDTFIDWQNFLIQVSLHKNVVVIWNGPGGYLIVEREVVAQIKEIQKVHHIKFIVTEMAASAQAMAICEFEDVQVSPHAVLIYHLAQDGVSGELIADGIDFTACQDKGFLTQQEVDKMQKDIVEVWVTFDEDGTRHVAFHPDRRVQQPSLEEMFLMINQPFIPVHI
jgi:hypothetical protein